MRFVNFKFIFVPIVTLFIVIFLSFYWLHKNSPTKADRQINLNDPPQIIQTTPSLTSSKITPTPQPSATPASGITKVRADVWSDFIYPNLVGREDQPNGVFMASPDSVQVITDWYKDRFNKLNYSTSSIVTNNVNGNSSNSLSVSNGANSLNVVINRDIGSDRTTIYLSSSISN